MKSQGNSNSQVVLKKKNKFRALLFLILKHMTKLWESQQYGFGYKGRHIGIFGQHGRVGP